jgi:O-antigen/teichoic acid export membrane protein
MSTATTFVASPSYRARVVSACLRLMPMVAKLALTLYMGRYFRLAEIGTYGLVVGIVAVLTALLGQRLEYVVTRDIVDVADSVAVHKMRDEALFYGVNYLLLALLIAVVVTAGMTNISPRILVYVLVLTVLESLGNITASNMNSLNQQIAANVIFFIRAGLWVLPVLVQCALSPSSRTAHVVLLGWIAGASISLLATLWYWRTYPWRQAMFKPIDWVWLLGAVRKSSFIWLGVVGMIAGAYVDRLVVLHFLNLDYVGALTLYASFTNALLTLSESGVVTFAYPRLVALHREGNEAAFFDEASRARWQSAIGTGTVAVVIGIFVPLAAHFATRPILAAEAWTLWLMLFGTWIRATAEIQVRILVARHQDRAVWVGNLLSLLPALACNLLLVPLLGLSGVGCSIVVTSFLHLLWCQVNVKRPMHLR